ncbi:MAG: ABC transporter substrate-binding protein [Candidatus Paceibacterota bacterium]|jgi:phospholipid transport system substrate-binding protein
MNFKHIGLISFLALLTGFLSTPCVMAAELPQPQALIVNASIKLKEKLQEKEFNTDFVKLNGYVDELLQPLTNFDLISSLVLGESWNSATENEQENFKKEFKTLLVRTYSRAFMEFKDWEIRYQPLTMAADTKKVVVKTQVIQPSTPPIAVSYRMLLVDGNWKVYDIVIEGISLVTNHRSTFKTEIQTKGSLNAVIAALAKRNAEALSSR